MYKRQPAVEGNNCKGTTQPGQRSPEDGRAVEAPPKQWSQYQDRDHAGDMIEHDHRHDPPLPAPQSTKEVTRAGEGSSSESKKNGQGAAE